MVQLAAILITTAAFLGECLHNISGTVICIDATVNNGHKLDMSVQQSSDHMFIMSAACPCLTLSRCSGLADVVSVEWHTFCELVSMR